MQIGSHDLRLGSKLLEGAVVYSSKAKATNVFKKLEECIRANDEGSFDDSFEDDKVIVEELNTESEF